MACGALGRAITPFWCKFIRDSNMLHDVSPSLSFFSIQISVCKKGKFIASYMQFLCQYLCVVFFNRYDDGVALKSLWESGSSL